MKYCKHKPNIVDNLVVVWWWNNLLLCLLFQPSPDIFSDIYFPMVTLKPKSSSSLPGRYRPTRSRTKRSAFSMYSNSHFNPHHINSSYLKSRRSPSQSSLYSTSYQQSLLQYNNPYQYYASSPNNYTFSNENYFKGLPFYNANAYGFGSLAKTSAVAAVHDACNGRNIAYRRDSVNSVICDDAYINDNGNLKGKFINNLSSDAPYKFVPIYFDARLDVGQKRIENVEDEPIYYDCDIVKQKERNFDVRSMTIREEAYGEV